VAFFKQLLIAGAQVAQITLISARSQCTQGEQTLGET
jgi:hypothetical protein